MKHDVTSVGHNSVGNSSGGLNVAHCSNLSDKHTWQFRPFAENMINFRRRM